jgi:two-component system sensor histidine kinase/response regulator
VTEQQQSPTRILIIDDELGMREGCRRALTPLGYAVDVAGDITAGARMLREGCYDLFLLDVMLPDGSGLDLLEPILAQDPLAICIIITGFGSIEVAVEAIRRGAYDFLSKPFTSDELLLRVNQGLERRRLKAIETHAIQVAEANAELERLDQAKTQLMLKIAHELRAPIAASVSYVNLIARGYIKGDEVKPTLARIQERLEEMLDLIADLLELSRLKQAKVQVDGETSPQDAAVLVERLCEFFREQAAEKKLDFQVNILARPTIIADQDHLRQLWTNLISNAIKYTPEGGRILVTLQADENRLIGSVQDTGIGIAAEDMNNLFQEFFRTDQAKASGEIGTGLGLSIVKQIVDSYGGEIKVDSQLGEGTRFTVILPLDPTRVQAGEAVTGPSPLPTVHRPLPDSGTHARALAEKEGS